MVYSVAMDSCLRYTSSGYVVIFPGDNPDAIVDALLRTGYAEEFCVALDFDPLFIARLMAAGFLVMSMKIPGYVSKDSVAEPYFLLLPKLHLIRSVLFFSDLHIKKSLKPLLQRYELRIDTDFQGIMERCVHMHGDDWLTLPLQESLLQIRAYNNLRVRPVSFGVYRNGELKAGEFGVLAGRVYTSYSGYYDENSAGTVQMVLTAQYLQEQGFAFLDLGMPLDYKDTLGACTIEPQRFVRLFRAAQDPRI
ncbi:MAG: GNAT family N-acetyltransferase [Treponema sp.]|jgi:Leu/Phe-tRNA-protein transferase|nr:GNAT family N-acetyltransferase [Treponema sp.]